ncbi:MAG: DUF6599 family protein [candidate division KSB1 bacterium]|nr:DUF6599 family protein [candidate division KSB1 bacterium]
MKKEEGIVLPDAILGWTASGEEVSYGRENLYEYINGGAELYLSYGFNSLTSRTYHKENQPDIVVDVFDMGAPRSAYGVFTFSREEVDDRFGQGSQYTQGLLLFWKGQYYVSILASPETDASREAVFSLADRICASIAREGAVPDVVHLLPREGLRESSVRYFHHHVWLNYHYYISDENILNIDRNTDAVLARYDFNNDTQLYLLLRYKDEESARTAYHRFTGAYLPELKDQPVVRIEDSSWTGCALDGNIIRAVFKASSRENANKLLELR